MADDQQHSWWKSLPGILTAATGFVAALSGLVAGLNQLGVFRREQAPQPVTVTVPVPDTTPQRPSTVSAPESAASAVAPETGRAGPPPPGPSHRTPPASAPAPTPRETAAVAVPDQAPRLPKGTAFELALTERACAPPSGQARATARLVAPVKVNGRTIVPANTTAVLRVSRAGSPAAPRVRLDSLVGPDLAAPVTASEVRIRNGTSGTCLRQGARMAVTLAAGVTVKRR